MIYIWIRRTTNWEDEGSFWAQLPPALTTRVELWNETFNIPFHIFRHRVKHVAQCNISDIHDAACMKWEDIPEGALVAPVDDDDWFAPNLGSVLGQAYAPGIVGLYWHSHFIEIPISVGHRLSLIRQALFAGAPPIWLCTTNNYAVVKSPVTEELAKHHVQASEWFAANEGSIKQLADHLSLMNRSLASQTSLTFQRPSIRRLKWVRKYFGGTSPGVRGLHDLLDTPVKRAQLVRKYRKYKRLYTKPLAPELAWAQPYVRMMGDLMEQLEVRSP